MWMQDCCDCNSAKSEGMHVWMEHLATCHTLPTEWPSDRADKLTGHYALRPYTTVTESKKKRRKDSVPRPLNSFMLFAQYIRRNVLRVYNDASNSVISQQLGDLWRTVPQEYRNQYDDEANRLVRIHQREFPNYKYQPKKRLSPNLSIGNGGGGGKGGTHALVSVTTADAFRTVASKVDNNCRSLSRPSVFQSFQSTNGSTFQRGTEATQLRSVPSVSSTQILRENNCKPFSEYNRNVTSKMNMKSPGSAVHCVITSTKSKPLTVNSTPFRANSTSLSSALPPLHTPLCRSFVANSEKHHPGLCDSAYASGINSSSSSSASSPSVGDIFSPNKLGHSAGIDGGKTTSANQRVQLVTIRPQSQQIPVSKSLPTRQRFLSATSWADDPMLNGSSVADELVVLAAPTMLTVANSGRNSQTAGHSIHQLTTQVYVRLSSGNNGSTNDVLLALPAGTTIIQPASNTPAATAHIPFLQHSKQGNEHVIVKSEASLTSHPKLNVTQSSKNAHPAVIPLYLANMKTSEDQPFEGSSNSSSPSSWSPLSGDVFLPLQQHIANPGDDHELKCKVESIAQTFSMDPIIEPTVFVHERDDALYSSERNLINKLDIEQVEIKSHTQDKVYTGFGVDEPDINNDSLDTWSFSVKAQSDCPKENVQDCILPATTSAQITTPVTSFIATTTTAAEMFPQNSGIVHQDTESTGSDFPITSEDNFDSSFDAMMNSIDLTSFLPGAFNGNEVMDYNIDNDLCEPGICPDNSTRHLGIMEEPQCTSSSSDVENSCLFPNSLRELQCSSVIDMETMVANLDRTAVIVNGGVACVGLNAHLCYADRHSVIVSKMADNIQRGENELRVISGSLICSGSQIITSDNLGCYDHLSDLDSLDKSSLILDRPDWLSRVRD